jgi:ComF family protein
MSWAAESLFATLFPSDCRLCGTALVKISRLPVCEDCLSTMRPIAGGVCSICGEGLVSIYAGCTSDAEPRCGLCQRVQPPFAKAAAYGSYDGGLRELIHLLKYEHVRPAANVLGRMLAESISDLKPSFGSAELLVVPVPLHAHKLRQRGFNQAELITRAALKLKPASEQLTLNVAVLQRRRETQSQIGLTCHQRRQNMRGAFAVVKPAEVEGREILMVDDVFATGTTVSECARVLRRAGANRVWVATVARTLKTLAAYAICEEEEEKAPVAMAAHG